MEKQLRKEEKQVWRGWEMFECGKSSEPRVQNRAVLKTTQSSDRTLGQKLKANLKPNPDTN